jgi:hypothetical protein
LTVFFSSLLYITCDLFQCNCHKGEKKGKVVFTFVRLTGIINVAGRTWFKNKNSTHSCPPYVFFFSQCTQEMARGVEQFGGGGGRPEQMK